MKTKKLTALLTAGILAVCAVPMGTSAEILKGDVNQNGVVDSDDAYLMMRFIQGQDITDYFSEEEIQHYVTYCDMDGDGYFYYDDLFAIGEMYSDITVNTEMGDVNHDGRIDAIDASLVLIYYCDLSIDNYDKYTEDQHENFHKYGDIVNYGDNKFVDCDDAQKILEIYAENSSIVDSE